jgi:hypothetical protein
MPLSCPEKNGADVYLREYGGYVHCDLYLHEGMMVLRITGGIHQDPPTGRVHGHVDRITKWFEDKPFGTLIVYGACDHMYYGYDGMTREEFLCGEQG